MARSAVRRHFFEAFATAAFDDGPPPVTADEARAVQALIEAAYRSAQDRVSVGLTESGA